MFECHQRARTTEVSYSKDKWAFSIPGPPFSHHEKVRGTTNECALVPLLSTVTLLAFANNGIVYVAILEAIKVLEELLQGVASRSNRKTSKNLGGLGHQKNAQAYVACPLFSCAPIDSPLSRRIATSGPLLGGTALAAGARLEAC